MGQRYRAGLAQSSQRPAAANWKQLLSFGDSASPEVTAGFLCPGAANCRGVAGNQYHGPTVFCRSLAAWQWRLLPGVAGL